MPLLVKCENGSVVFLEQAKYPQLFGGWMAYISFYNVGELLLDMTKTTRVLTRPAE